MFFERLEGLGNRRWVRVALVILALAFVANLVVAALSWKGSPPRPAYLAIAAGLALVPWLTNTLRLCIWGRFAGGKVRIRDGLQIAVASDLGAALAPTLAGTGAVRFAMLLHRGLSAGKSSAVLIIMGVEDALFFAAFVPLAFILTPGSQGDALRSAALRVADRAAWVLGAAAALWLVSALLFRRKRFVPGRLLAAARDARQVLGLVLRRGKLRALVSLALTTIQWITRYSVATAVLAAFAIPADPVLQILLQWVVYTAGSIVPTPGGAGAIEGAFAALYAPLVPEANLAAVTAVWRFVLFYFVLALDVVVLAGFFLVRQPPATRGEVTDPTESPPPQPPKRSSRRLQARGFGS